MEEKNLGLKQLFKYANSHTKPYKDQLRSTNVDTFKRSYTFSIKDQEFVLDTTLDNKDW